MATPTDAQPPHDAPAVLRTVSRHVVWLLSRVHRRACGVVLYLPAGVFSGPARNGDSDTAAEEQEYRSVGDVRCASQQMLEDYVDEQLSSNLLGDVSVPSLCRVRCYLC